MTPRSFELVGPAGRLEAILMEPEGAPRATAVVCHAHPLHGGMMHFKVVFRAAKALQHHGVAVLRFNFRGVGHSQGVHDHGRGEREDVRAAMGEMGRRYPNLPLVLGGFSFGSMMALQVGAADHRPRALFALGFPVRLAPDLSFLAACRAPRLFVQGEHDEFGAGTQLEQAIAVLPEPKQVVVVAGSDHFFTGRLDALQRAIESWASGEPWEAPPLA